MDLINKDLLQIIISTATFGTLIGIWKFIEWVVKRRKAAKAAEALEAKSKADHEEMAAQVKAEVAQANVTLQTQVAELLSQLNAVTGAYEAAKTAGEKVPFLEREIARLEAEIEAIKKRDEADIARLLARIAELEAENARQKADYEAQIATLRQRISELERRSGTGPLDTTGGASGTN